MTSLTQNKVLRSIRLKSMLLCSRLFPNVKEFAVTLATAICTLYFLVVLEKKSGGAAVPMKLVSTGGSHLDDFLRGKVTSDGAWCWFADPRAIYFKGIRKTNAIEPSLQLTIHFKEPRPGERMSDG